MDYATEIDRCLAVESKMQEVHQDLWAIYADNPSENMAKVIEMHGAVRRELATHRYWFQIRLKQEPDIEK